MTSFASAAFDVPTELLQRYNTTGPRYTSYPTVPQWTDAFDALAYESALTAQQHNHLPLALYVHLPFCAERCLFCGCNVVITRQVDQAEKYLGYLFKEIEHVATLVDTSRPVVQIHWGGGTPTYLNSEQLERLYNKLTQHFHLAPEAEVALEVDPRVTTQEQLNTLKSLGFNRVSMGVQDFTPKVQKTIHRVQPYEMTKALVDGSRELGFEGLNLDLIYGLPYQTVETFEATVQQIIQLSPDRIALYNYAHVPWMSPHQQQMPEAALPDGETKFAIFRMAIRSLMEAGYRYIGMDHFAKPDDALSTALDAGTLHRNFMGYTTRSGQAELLGVGVSAISSLQGHYAQNEKKLSTYYAALDEGRLPTCKGIELTEADQLRRTLINRLLCQGVLNFGALQRELGFDVRTEFDGELQRLQPLVADGLLDQAADEIRMTWLGRVFARNSAMVFDAYLQEKSGQQQRFF